ncbi:MAG: biopolymer transporter ExbD [Dysgonamonadaceae bacterium]|jgi:biopolymer transport protein ExbD|nr:biopolymer transporter ExbD [Dysgonamonadaceae bacterium]
MARKRKKRKVMPLNGAALADISFLFLIFFLLTATMDVDSGLPRQLPRPVQEDVSMEIERRNMFVVMVNRYDQIQVTNMHVGEIYENTDEIFGTSTKASLKDKVKEFVLNESNLGTLPALEEQDFGDPIGVQLTTGNTRVISLQNDATTSYRAYMVVQNELVRAFNELRQDASRRFFNTNYDELTTAQREQIDRFLPQRISEAEPRDFSGGR